jgi:hypothetical protein
MPARQIPRTEPTGTQPSDTDRVLTTLDKVFTKFGDGLRNDTPKPFTGSAEIAVGVFSDIVAGVKLESRPHAVDLEAKAPSATQVELTWTDDAGNADGYRVERGQGRHDKGTSQSGSDGSEYGGPDLEEIARLPSTARFFRDSGLSPQTRSSYRVVAFNARGEAPSNVVDITPAYPATNE